MAFEYLEQYSLFKSVEEMDKQIAERIEHDRFELTKSERTIVFAMKKHCLKYAGVCHLKNETIAKEVGVSLITVSRAIRKLVKMGIINKVNQPKMNGIKGANIYYFLPQQNDVSNVTHRGNAIESNTDAVCSPQDEEGSIKSFNLLKTSNLYDVYSNIHQEKEARKEWMNEYQIMLFDFMYSLPLRDDLKDQLHKCILAA